MKNLVFWVITLNLTFFLFYFSCTKEVTIAPNTPKEVVNISGYGSNGGGASDSLCVFSTEGQQHNDGLEFIYGRLAIENADWSEEGAFQEVETAYYDYVTDSLGFTSTEANDNLNLLKTYQDALFEDDLYRITFVLDSIGVDIIDINTLVEITTVLDSTYSDFDELLEALSEKENEIVAQDRMTEIVELSINGLKASICYWSNNLDRWEENIPILQPRWCNHNKKWFWETVNSMTEDDFWGFAVGAGMGAIIGGVGAAPGSVAGAFYSSAASGIKGLFKGC